MGTSSLQGSENLSKTVVASCVESRPEFEVIVILPEQQMRTVGVYSNFQNFVSIRIFKAQREW